MTLPMPTPAEAPTAPSRPTSLQRVALIALQYGTAGWIGYGAFVKATEFNPLLLPPPIMSALRWVMESTSVDATAFLEWSLRAIIGAEIFIALAILATRWARTVAIATLSFFCLILLTAMIQAGLKDGLKEALAGSCGCFGKAGLPASVMFLVDAVLLACAWIAPASGLRARVPIAIPAVIGLVAVFAVPKPEVAGGGPQTTEQTGTDSTQQPDKPAPQPPAANAISGPWPAAPAQYEKNYFTKWPEWVGKPIRSQKIALAIERPLPDDFERGDWIVMFSRQDCEVCQRVCREHFAKPRKERVLKVAIYDTMDKTLAMPCEGCVSTSLYRVRAGQQGKSPTYLIQTPVLLRLKDGIVTAVCNNVDNAEQLAAVVAPAETKAPVAAEQPAAAKPAWPGLPPKLEPFYIAEYKDSVGKPFASNTFSRLIAGEIPADFLSGRWIVIFYREDCEHCHDLLMTYFTGKLPVRTLAVAIPDTDPAGHLDNPCEECVKRSLVKGPNFVIGTPVIVAIQDGVVECVVEDANDLAAVEACLKFPAQK